MSMQIHEHVIDKQNVNLYIYEGVLQNLSDQTISDTHISGGGGFVTPTHGGITNPIHSSTTHTRIIDFWLIDEADGRETSFRLRDIDIPLRDGQQVSIGSIGEKGSNKANILAIKNHNAGTTHWVQNPTDLINKYASVELFHHHFLTTATKFAFFAATMFALFYIIGYIISLALGYYTYPSTQAILSISVMTVLATTLSWRKQSRRFSSACADADRIINKFQRLADKEL